MLRQHIFQKLDSDSDDRAIPNTSYRASLNLIPGKNATEDNPSRENIKSNKLVPYTFPAGTNKCIGRFEDDVNKRIIFFMHNSNNNHGIYAYYHNQDSIQAIFQFNFGWTADLKITGIDVIDNLLYWTDFAPKYYVIEEDYTAFMKIRYNFNPTSSGFAGAIFQVTSPDGSVSISKTVATISTSLTKAQMASQFTTAFNNDSVINPYFNAVNKGDWVEITATTIRGQWKTNQTSGNSKWFTYYPTNYYPVVTNSNNLTLIKRPALVPPTAEKVYDSAVITNLVADKNYQFNVRYVYINNEESVFGPFSEIVPSNNKIDDPSNTTDPNKINVTIAIEEDLIHYLKYVDVGIRNKETGALFIVKTYERHEIFTELVYEHTGQTTLNAVDDITAAKTEEPIPRESKSLSIARNRIFMVMDKEGYDVDPSSFKLTSAQGDEVQDTTKRYFKEGGKRQVGIYFMDDYGRKSSNYQVDIVDFSYHDILIQGTTGNIFFGKDLSKSKVINWALTGVGPSWATKFGISLSKELFYDRYAQTNMEVKYFVRNLQGDETAEEAIDDTTNPSAHEVVGGKLYLVLGTDDDAAGVDKDSYNSVHLFLPRNAPIIPSKGMFVRLMTPMGNNGFVDGQASTLVNNVEVVGVNNVIVLSKDVINDDFIGLNNANLASYDLFRFELYSIKNAADNDKLFETASVFSMANGVFSVTSGKLYGSTFYKEIGFGSRRTSAGTSWLFGEDLTPTGGALVESASPTFSTTIYESDFQGSDGDGLVVVSVNKTEQIDAFVLDQGFATDNVGRIVPTKRDGETSSPTVLLPTNSFVDDSNINGLHNADAGNKVTLPSERGPVIKFIQVSEDVMVALHERATTSVYIGRQFITSADGQEILAKSDRIVGDDRRLRGTYGTVNPESVVENNGRVYYWDAYRFEPMRYSNDGLTPLGSLYGFRNFFHSTGQERFKYLSESVVLGAYHPLWEMYIITFAPITSQGIPAKTIGFSEKFKGWITDFSFLPDEYEKINNDLITWKNGQLYVQEAGVGYNNFYGVQYPSEIEITVNPEGPIDKVWEHIGLDSNEKWQVVEITNDQGQVTNLNLEDFEHRGDMYYADILRDLNTPSQALEPGQVAIRHGANMRSQVVKMKFRNNLSTRVELNSINVGYQPLDGHLIAGRE